MSELQTFILLMIFICFIGICILMTEEEDRWTLKGKMIIVDVFICMILLFVLHMEVQGDKQEEMPSTGFGDTEVDRMLDEVRSDRRMLYNDEEVQVLVYKYLLKYTREGKYEVTDEEQKRILREAAVDG